MHIHYDRKHGTRQNITSRALLTITTAIAVTVTVTATATAALVATAAAAAAAAATATIVITAATIVTPAICFCSQEVGDLVQRCQLFPATHHTVVELATPQLCPPTHTSPQRLRALGS